MKLFHGHPALGFFPLKAAVIYWATVAGLSVSSEGASPNKNEFKATTADALEGEIRAAQLLGKKIYDSEQRRVGTLKDIVFTREAFSEVTLDKAQDRLMLAIKREVLEERRERPPKRKRTLYAVTFGLISRSSVG